MDRDELIRYLERKIKIRVLHDFEAAQESLGELERDFAIEALDLMRRQPAMEELLELTGVK
jgi:hypothetical protein